MSIHTNTHIHTHTPILLEPRTPLKAVHVRITWVQGYNHRSSNWVGLKNSFSKKVS